MATRQVYETCYEGLVDGVNRLKAVVLSRSLGGKGTKLITVSEGERAALQLEGMVDLESRKDIYRKRLKGGRDILIKPYASRGEKEAISRLKDSDITFILGSNEFYFAEEKPRIPTIENLLGIGAINLQEIAPLFAMALYQMHSRGIAYNRSYDNSLYFAKPETLKVTNFSMAAASATLPQIREGLMRALEYMESLSTYDTIIKFQQSGDRPEKDRVKTVDAYFYKAVASFVASYVLEMHRDDNKQVIEELRELLKQMAKSQQDTLLSRTLNHLNKLMSVP